MAEETGSNSAPQLAFTEEAVAKLQEVIGGYPRPVAGLRLQIVGRGPEGFDYVLSLVEQGKEPEGDALVDVQGLRVFIEGKNVESLDGTKIDYRYKGPNTSGLEFDNPNPLWRDPVAIQIQQLFDEQINPAIAAHGGYVSLLDVQGDTAYVQLGGGCQGCGMADVTLKQGIEVAIKETVPAITNVVDETDHASGTNPYFRPSKK
jgi:Fe/S biogenesis protein NfuA